MFDIRNTTGLNTDKLNDGLEYDYVTRTSNNQGILQTTGFVNQNNLNEAGVWSLGLLQMDFFYRKRQWYAGQFVRKIVPKIELTQSAILFFTALLNCQKKILLSVLVRNVDETFRNLKIQLPITANGEIDFDFMENFISELEKEYVCELEAERVRELEAYLKASGLSDTTLNPDEKSALNTWNSRIWQEFKIGDLFDVYTGRDVIINQVKDGVIPLISHKNSDNGVSKYIQKLNNRILFDFKNTISLADRGVFCASTQKENFYIGTRVKALKFKSGDKSLNIRLFFVTSINKLQNLFLDYSANATDDLPNLNIKLPVTSNGEIDFDFMESFIKAIQKESIKGVDSYLAKNIATTKEVINN